MKAKAVPPPTRRAAAAPLPPAFWRRPEVLYPAGLVLLGLAIYSRSLTGPFLFDDTDLIESSAIRARNIFIILTGPRPLTNLSFGFNYRLTGFNPFAFHVVSLVLHLVNTLLLWGVVRRLCALPAVTTRLEPAGRRVLAWAVPLLFLVSPVQTESVAYISSRSELWKTGPYFAALLVFLSSWREARPWLAALLVTFFYGCAVAGKEDGLTLPIAIALLDYLLVSECDWRRMRRNWPVYALLVAVMVLGAWVKVRPLLNVPSAGFSLRDVTWQQYLFTQFRMYFLYLWRLVVPFGLNADYDIAASRTLVDHFSWLALAGLVMLVGAGLWFHRRQPLAVFGVLLFLLALAPTSSFYPLLDYAAERRLYLPAAGFFLAAVTLLAARWGNRRDLAVALGLVAAVNAAGAYNRNGVWEDSLALWQDTVEKSPQKWRVWNNLGREYSDRGRFEEATKAYERAAELIPRRRHERLDVLSSLGSTYANRKMYPEAVKIYEEGLKIDPGHPRLLTNLAMTELRLNRPTGWEHFEQAIHGDPVAWEPHLARGNFYYQMGRYDDAIKDYERVLQLLPSHPDAQYNLNAARGMKARQEQQSPGRGR
jgi:tetratricopeptide (TPR) repeat protein